MTALHGYQATTDPLLGLGAARLLGATDPSLATHLARYGHMSADRFRGLVSEVEAAGLRGRGGAGFPTAVKMAAVVRYSAGRIRREPAVVANATEGEPASAKDRVLLRRAPHLVLDGMVAAASAVGAARAVLCVERRDEEAVRSLRHALHERRGRDPIRLEVAGTPSRYVAGEESALIAWLNGNPAKPTFTGYRPAERGVRGAPTLLDNAETLAHVALIARFGAGGYRTLGEPEEPGTALVTVRGAVDRPGVYEIPLGSSLGSVVSGTGSRPGRGALIGGYFGTWVPAERALVAPLSARGLAPFGASLGCGLVAVMPDEHCPLQEVSRVMHWLAANSAGQCGPCVNGLPALAEAFDRTVAGDRGGAAERQLDRWSPMVVGRGACKLPDGAVRFMESARRTFGAHIAEHRHRGPCPPNISTILPTPALGGWR